MRSSQRKGRVMLIAAVVIILLVAGACIFLAVRSAMAERPTNLGKRPDGTLAPTPTSPNAVSTFATDKQHQIRPYDYVNASDAAWRKLREVVESLPNAKIVTATDDYMHVEFTSKLFRFVDDVEFLLDPGERKIQFRSASRTGHSDLGVNRSRMEDIRVRFGATVP